MEETMAKFSRTLASFCNHLHRSCDAFKHSLDRRPIPLDSASTTFIQSLNRRVSSFAGDLDLLESMAFGTVSFEELLGHCNEFYKKNQSDFVDLRRHLHSLGYLSSDIEVNDVEEDFTSATVCTPTKEDDSQLLTSYEGSMMKKLEGNSVFDDSMSLQNLGLSDVCLATIASEGDVNIDGIDNHMQVPVRNRQHSATRSQLQDVTNLCGKDEDEPKPTEASMSSIVVSSIVVSKEDYESLPSYMKSLASWEDLLVAVEKINSSLNKKANLKESNYFHPEELESMGLGPKGRSYLVLLVRLKRLVVEINDGLLTYRVL